MFFMLIPRSWSFAQRQRSPSQTLEAAKPAALDARFKVASALATIGLGLIVFRLGSGSQVYRSKIPLTLLLIIVLLAIRIAYGLAGTWVWALSPYRLSIHIGWLYGLGYAPTILILMLLNGRGYLNENEDKILISQRASRGDASNHSIHIALQDRGNRTRSRRNTPPPWWFRPRNSSSSPPGVFGMPPSSPHHLSENRIRSPSPRFGKLQDESGHYWWQRWKQGEEDARCRKPRQDITESSSVGGATRDEMGTASAKARELEEDDRLQSGRWKTDGKGGNDGLNGIYAQPPSKESSTHSLRSPPQVVRSMLDV